MCRHGQTVGTMEAFRESMTLTEVKIRSAKPGPKPVKLFDGGGLFLYVSTGKHWRWAYRFDGKPKTMGLGQYPEITLAEARNRHFEARKLLASGVDPLEQRKASKVAANEASESFKTVALAWHKSWSSGKNPDYAAD